MNLRVSTILGILSVSLTVAGLLSGCGNLSGSLDQTVRDMEKRQSLPSRPLRPIAREDLASLPPIVRRYLEFSGVVGKVPVQRVRVRQEGRMKTSLKAEWRGFRSEEYYTLTPRAFAWLGTFPLAGPLTVQAIDRFIDGRGSLKVRLSPFFDIGNTRGPESDVSEFIRFFNEMTWFPTAMLDPRIAWADLGNRRVKATLRDGSLEASAILSFAENGALLSWMTDDRFALVDDKMVRARWTTTCDPKDLLNVAGYKIPRGGAAIYSLPGGDFRYIDIYVTEIEYDPPELLYRR